MSMIFRIYPLAFYLTIVFIGGGLCYSCTPEPVTQAVSVTSPNQVYTFTLVPGGPDATAHYSLSVNGRPVIGPSQIGVTLADGTVVGDTIQVVEQAHSTVDQHWQPVYGEKSEYPEVYQESLLTLEDDGYPFQLRVRAYNEGVAFRYEFTDDRGDRTIREERTEFALPPTASSWSSLYAQSDIRQMPIAQLPDSAAVERPLLVQLADSLFVAIGEADVVNYARMKLLPQADAPGTLVAHLSSEVVGEAPRHTPWRWVMAGRTAGEILENNYLVLNLNEPCQIDDTSWIRPGKVIREVTLTTQGGLACVDFAVKHHLQFVEFDAGWYGNEYDDVSDATTVTVDPKRSDGPLDLPQVIEYAKSNDIGVLLYVNRRSLEKQLDEVLSLTSEWGVAGLKYGFVNVGPQEWTQWLHDAVRKAADHQLMVDIHDEYRPTGYSRTYPNLMTQEGIRGDEESPDNATVLRTLFTRMLAGAGDHTNCYFADRVDAMGSHASQLAKAVCIYSPWQFLYWYDRPIASPGKKGGAGESDGFIQEVPELEFYDALPTVWDDTHVLEGYPGEYAAMARRQGDGWFLGALTGNQGRDFVLPLTFLDADRKYEATLYTDDAHVPGPTRVAVKKLTVTHQDTIRQTVAGSGGMAAMFHP